jgi:hypothetical protein
VSPARLLTRCHAVCPSPLRVCAPRRCASRPRRVPRAQLSYCRAPLARRAAGGPRNYCLRYRLCEAHLRALCVHVDGVECRWCQKCSRFHTLDAFAVRAQWRASICCSFFRSFRFCELC